MDFKLLEVPKKSEDQILEEQQRKAIKNIIKETMLRQHRIKHLAECYFNDIVDDDMMMFTYDEIKKIAQKCILIAEIWVNTVDENFPELVKQGDE